VLVGCWLARLLIQEWFSHLLQLTFLSKTDQKFLNSCRSSKTKLSQLIFDTCTHHCPVEKNIKTGWIQCVDPQWCQRYKSEKQWKGSLPGCEWIVDLIKTILRVAMKWKFGDKRDMWCCPSPEWTVGLEAVLERNYFVQFWKERKMQNCLHCSLTSKNSKWGFSLKSFTGRTPSWPHLPQKLCPNLVGSTSCLCPAIFVKEDVISAWI